MAQLAGFDVGDAALSKDLFADDHYWATSPLLDTPLWSDDGLFTTNGNAAVTMDHQVSSALQVVPDPAAFSIDLDLPDIAAGLQQHLKADSPPADWAPCQDCSNEFGAVLKHASPSSVQHHNSHSQQGGVLALQANAADDTTTQHWRLVPQQQQQQAVAAAAPAGFSWPCPEPLRCSPSNDSRLKAATMVPLVFPSAPSSKAPATPATAAPSTDDESCGGTSSCYSSGGHQQHQPLFKRTPTQPGSWLSQQLSARSSSTGDAGVRLSFADSRNVPAAPRSGNKSVRAQHDQQRATTSAPATAAGARAAASCHGKLLGPAAIRTRAEAVARYKLKRARRGLVQPVKYQRRKEYAQQRPRVGGRFVKKAPEPPQQQE